MSGIRISEFKKPRTIIVDQAKVDSAYGPKSSILLESLATSWSKNGFTIEVKGLSRDSLLNGMFVSIPLQIRWKAQGGVNLIVSEFFDRDDPYGYSGNFDQSSTAKKNLFLDFDVACRAYDGVCVRPNAFKCIRNATLSINGSSFSTRTDAYYTAMCKLFCDGRQESISGAAYENYPYTNCGDAKQALVQKGWFERCRNLNTMGKIVKVTYHDDGNKRIDDIVIEYNVKFPLWFGPFTHLGFPGLSGFDGQSVASIPYVSDLVLECTFTDDVLMDAFAAPDTNLVNGLSVHSPAWMAKSNSAGTDWMPNTYAMWNSAVPQDIKNDTSQYVGILQPKLCYMFSEPDPDKMTIAPIYTLPSYRFITYEDRKAITGADFNSRVETVNISFPYIRLSNISALYIALAEGARVDVSAGGIAARSSRYHNGAWNSQRLGLACANRTCPIKWDTVRVSMSTSSSVLTNFVQNTITEQRQFELFKKYSNDAMALTFDQWRESSQMLLFSAEELCGIGAFANSFQALTLSVSFDVYRDATDTKLTPCQFTAASDQAASALQPGIPHISPDAPLKGNDKKCAIVGRLICIEPELVSISEGAVSVEQVKLSQAEIHAQLMGGAPEVEDANQLDQLAR